MMKTYSESEMNLCSHAFQVETNAPQCDCRNIKEEEKKEKRKHLTVKIKQNRERQEGLQGLSPDVHRELLGKVKVGN